MNWKRKRFDYLRCGINLVEIDLLRGGNWALPDRSLLKPLPPGRAYHHVAVTRPPWIGRCEFYVLPLRERLPAIRVPLRRSDLDAALDLQVLVDQCYERGKYAEVIDYARRPNPPLFRGGAGLGQAGSVGKRYGSLSYVFYRPTVPNVGYL